MQKLYSINMLIRNSAWATAALVTSSLHVTLSDSGSTHLLLTLQRQPTLLVGLRLRRRPCNRQRSTVAPSGVRHQRNATSVIRARA